MIEFNAVAKRYPGGHQALQNVSFSAADGELLYLTGHSGAGKSTLLKLIPAIERVTSGAVLVNGQNLNSMSRSAIPFLRRNLGLIFQDQKLLYDRSVYENVMLPLAIAGFPHREAVNRAHAALDKVGLLARERANPVTLSGGEQQRLCIARAVVNRPSILLADEPTSNVDAQYADEIMRIFGSFHQVGVTILIATHDTGLLARHPGRQLRLEHGTVVA
jgi:cell division transport system ATP-binding protein